MADQRAAPAGRRSAFPQMISTSKRLTYAEGYIALQCLEEAAAELEAVDPADHHLVEYIAARVRLHQADHRWDELVRYGRIFTIFKPSACEGWLALAAGLRAQGRIEEARTVLHEAEALHGRTSGVLHYRLACCYALLSDFSTARQHLERAQELDDAVAESARLDPDLEPLWAGP